MWIPHQIVPFIIDECLADASTCKYTEYISYSLKKRDQILSATDKSYKELISFWIQEVSESFGWDINTLESLFDYNTDTHNSEMRTRYMWKYAASKGVSGTPTFFVNGVMLQNPPSTADEWLQLLNDVY